MSENRTATVGLCRLVTYVTVGLDKRRAILCSLSCGDQLRTVRYTTCTSASVINVAYVTLDRHALK